MRESDLISDLTSRVHQDACCDPVLNWQDRQDFEFASRGLICRPNDRDIRDADGDIVWHHEESEVFLNGEAPAIVHPSLWRDALPKNYLGFSKSVKVCGTSVANLWVVYIFDPVILPWAISPWRVSGPDVIFEGDKTVLSSLADMLDMFPAWFPIATHDLKSGEANL